MTRSERDKIEAEREARRAKRLSERAEQRARRKAEQAKRAAERAEELAERAHRRSPRHRNLERSIEDVVDDVTEKWARKAENWMHEQGRKIDKQSRRMFDEDAMGLGDDGLGLGSKDDLFGTGDSYSDDYADDYGTTDHMDDYDHEDYSERRERRSESRRRAKRRERMRRRKARLKDEFALHRERRRFKRRNRNGNLYRNTQNKKIFGVCSGIADYWGMETWQVRLMAVVALFVIPSIAVPGYFIASFLMDDKPYYRTVTDRFHELDEPPGQEAMSDRKPKPSRPARQRAAATVDNPQALQTAKGKFADIEQRLRKMETHVTSPKFELQRELKKIAGDEA